MDLVKWIGMLEENERSYVSKCIEYWTSGNGTVLPLPPPGLSQVKADLLRYHTRSLLEDFSSKAKRIKKQASSISIRIPKSLEIELKTKAQILRQSESELVRACIELGLPILEKNPIIINYFK